MCFWKCSICSNENLQAQGEPPVAFRARVPRGEVGGACCFLINGVAHGAGRHHRVATFHAFFFFKELRFRQRLKAGGALAPFPSSPRFGRRSISFRNRIIHAGGLHHRTPAEPRKRMPSAFPRIPPKPRLTRRLTCGCGACVAACPNCRRDASSPLAKIPHLTHSAGATAARSPHCMVAAMTLTLGSCTNHGECEAVFFPRNSHRSSAKDESANSFAQHARHRGDYPCRCLCE